jgi:hypothetical protein
MLRRAANAAKFSWLGEPTMWDAIGHVTTGVTLVAFLAAAAVTAYRAYLKSSITSIEALPPDQRGPALARQLNAFGIDARNLTRAQQFEIAVSEVSLRSRRLLIIAATVVVISLICCAVAIFALFPWDSASRASLLQEHNTKQREIEQSIGMKRAEIEDTERDMPRYYDALDDYDQRIDKHMANYTREQIAMSDRIITKLRREIAELQERLIEEKQVISRLEQSVISTSAKK